MTLDMFVDLFTARHAERTWVLLSQPDRGRVLLRVLRARLLAAAEIDAEGVPYGQQAAYQTQSL